MTKKIICKKGATCEKIAQELISNSVWKANVIDSEGRLSSGCKEILKMRIDIFKSLIENNIKTNDLKKMLRASIAVIDLGDAELWKSRIENCKHLIEQH